MKSDKVLITGIICLTLLEAFALSQGINGTLFTVIVIIIAGAIGVNIEKPNFLKGGK